MPYNRMISRTGVEALIPEEVSREIIQGVPQASAVMSMARRLPNMSTSQRRMPVLSGLMTAYFVTGDTGLKQTDQLAWGNKYLNAEEMAVIVPIPESVLDDQNYDIWGEVRPRIVEAFGKLFDQAVLFGINAPQDWPTNILTAATSAGNDVTVAGVGDIYDDLMGVGGVISKVEEAGYAVSGHIAALSMRARLRGLRERVYNGTTLVGGGSPLFTNSMQTGAGYLLDNSPIYFPMNGSMIPTSALMFSGDWNQLVYSMRQDITYKVLDQAVIQDAAGNIIYNLAQQDMVALRAVMRVAWQLPNPINAIQPTEAQRYPFAVYLP